ncbi:MAG: hypothetical protein FWG67_07075 [Defluviitaleaceae bacterium]|nr:hypothetical protein [Defluviitaleaceae bacterium]
MIKKIKKGTAVVLTATSFLVACQADQQSEDQLSHHLDEQCHLNDVLNIRPITDEGMLYMMDEMFDAATSMELAKSFGVSQTDLVLGPFEDFYGVIEIDDVSDSLTAYFANHSTDGLPLLLKFFLNYEAVPFSVVGSGCEAYAPYFLFFLARGYEIDLEFTIHDAYLLPDSTNKLTMALFTDPQREVITDDDAIVFRRPEHARILNNDLIVGTGENRVEVMRRYQEVHVRQENQQFMDLWVAPEFEMDEFDLVAFPELHIQVHPGEDIRLQFYTSPQPGAGYALENYLIIGLLNWEQVRINGEPFFIVDTANHGLNHVKDHGYLILDGIDEVGYHELVFFLIENPLLPNSLANSFPQRASNRLLVEVVAE